MNRRLRLPPNARSVPKALAVQLALTMALALGTGFLPTGLEAQRSERTSGAENALVLSSPQGAEARIPLVRHRGYPAVSQAALRQLGWALSADDDRYLARLGEGDGALLMSLHPGAPFVQVSGSWAQLVNAPYELGDTLFLPLQLLSDLLPDRYPEYYRAESSRRVSVRSEEAWTPVSAGALGAVAPASTAPGGGPESSSGAVGGGATGPAAAQGGQPAPPSGESGTRVVIIDPGHGGRDPGALGGRQGREKDVTLAVGLALADRLAREPGIEVHMTRSTDTLVALWERGEIATEMKAERYGVFISIHANSVSNRGVRGVETYFLSEARSDHEERVAALENSVVELERGMAGPPEGGLDFIISDLLNTDFQRWSLELAGLTQTELARVHPGPDRGVKQGPFAVLTNAMMPSVLVEVGFITHPDEEALLLDQAFHDEVAEALSRAVVRFFEQYPPGGEWTRNGS